MGAALKNWMESAKLKKWFRRDNLIVMVLSGLLLVLAALPLGGGAKSREGGAEDSPEEDSAAQEKLWEAASGGTEGTAGGEDYAAYLEERLEELLSGMNGVGKVRVMITLSASSELVVQRENPVTRSATNETDSQGGNRVVNQVETQDAVVYRSQGTDSEPYVIKTLPPRIEGVLVVAEGAGSGTVNRTVTAIVQALFDVEAHKVSVVKMEQGQREEKNVE